MKERIADVAIASVGARGDGVGTLEGKAVYVPFSLPGDRLSVRLISARGDGFAGEIASVHERSPFHTEPPCTHYTACGGCVAQHMTPEFYRTWKRGLVADTLRRVGIAESIIAPVVETAPQGRRRATFAARKAGARVVLGFNSRQSSQIVDISACTVLVPEIPALLPALRNVLADVMAGGMVLDVSVTSLSNGLDVLLTGKLDLNLSTRERLARFAEDANLSRLAWRENEFAEAEPVVIRQTPLASFGGVPVALPAGAFLQASAEGEAALVRLVREGVGAATQVADLFAGCGTFTFPLAAQAKIYAAESHIPAVQALKAAAHGLSVTAEIRNLEREPLTPKELSRFDAVVFDPPRAGAAAQSINLAQSKVPVVVGVSCNPATFARDARTLIDGGYTLQKVTPVDQFVWSSHVELVGVFTR